eukprot:TRINITY_DN6570_c0_g1_i1.p1 TRINITY_DN6570_c0_g1~~TRINITY_DN6570_c0_g1_i1.p1  ORF type:complete len:180 (-),score=55.50 TRINITY_DN6570_c0_g1_i1:661-1140(-)
MLRTGGNTTGALVSGFSLLAVVTSVVGNVTGLVDFVNDGLLSTRLLTNAQVRRYSWVAYAVTLVPPTAIAVVSPDAFFLGARLGGHLRGVGPFSASFRVPWRGSCGGGRGARRPLPAPPFRGGVGRVGGARGGADGACGNGGRVADCGALSVSAQGVGG